MAIASKGVMKMMFNKAQRVLLHFACVLCDKNWTWHWQGIKREFPR
jgi:hypothetical protein